MGARLRSWWKQIKQHRAAIGVVGMVLVVVITLIIAGYWYDWTGFGGYSIIWIPKATNGTSLPITRLEEQQPAKTLWDWLQLLIIPLVLAVVALLFNLANSRTERQIANQRYKQDQQIAEQRYEQDQQIAKQRYEQDQQIALDKQREGLLQAYLDRISELLLKEKLRSSAVDAEVRNVARVRTITILFQLDARRIEYIFAFLREARLMSATSDSIISLKQANLSTINFSQAHIGQADLSKANLNKANLRGAALSDADLQGADLTGVDLIYANLSGAALSDADLSNAYLSKADLSFTDLTYADLSFADLTGAKVTEEQLAEVKSLQGATLPDGSKHS